MAKKMSLSFSSTTCTGCGAERLLGDSCPDCGVRPRPSEVQSDVVRRAAVLREFEMSRDGCRPDIAAIPADLDDAMSSVGALINNLQQALSAAAIARPGAALGLANSFAELDIFVQHWTKRHPRPTTNRARSFGRSLELLQQGFDVFPRALVARNIHEAQTLEHEGQSLINRGTAEIARLHEIASTAGLLNGPDPFSKIGLTARAAAGGDRPLELLDRRLQELAGEGPSKTGVGLGVNLSMFRHIILVCLDLEECLEVTRTAEENLGSVREICSDPWWQRRHGVVTAQFSSATYRLSQLEEENDLEAAGALLQLVMQCRDGVIRHCLATLLADSSEAYTRLSKSSAGSVIKRAAEQIPGLRLDENLSSLLRHAGAHFDYDIDGDHFVTHPNATGNEVRIGVDDFMDQVLGYVQTSVSLIVAVVSRIAAEGLDLEVSRHTPERDLLRMAEVLLGFCGYASATASREGDSLRIHARGDVDGLATPVAGIAAIAVGRFRAVEAVITADDGTIGSWESEVAPFLIYQERSEAASETDEILALAELMSTIRINSVSAWSEDQWAAVAMMVLNTLPSLSLRRQVQLIRRLQDLATTADQTTVVTTLGAVLKVLRESAWSDPPTLSSPSGPLVAGS